MNKPDDAPTVQEVLGLVVVPSMVGEVIEALNAAGYVIVKGVERTSRETPARHLIRSTAFAWANAVRAEWAGFAAANREFAAQIAIARQLIRQRSHNGQDVDPICLTPDTTKPAMAKLEGGGEAMCIEPFLNLPQVAPLSVIYAGRVGVVMLAARKVALEQSQKDAQDFVFHDPPLKGVI